MIILKHSQWSIELCYFWTVSCTNDKLHLYLFFVFFIGWICCFIVFVQHYYLFYLISLQLKVGLSAMLWNCQVHILLGCVDNRTLWPNTKSHIMWDQSLVQGRWNARWGRLLYNKTTAPTNVIFWGQLLLLSGRPILFVSLYIYICRHNEISKYVMFQELLLIFRPQHFDANMKSETSENLELLAK